MRHKWIGLVLALVAGLVLSGPGLSGGGKGDKKDKVAKDKNDKKDKSDKKDKPRTDTDKRDDIVGARWEYTVTNEKGKEIETGTFRASKGQIFSKEKVIGTYKEPAPEQVVMEIAQGELKGKTTLRRVKDVPATYRGELVRDSAKLKIQLIIQKD